MESTGKWCSTANDQDVHKRSLPGLSDVPLEILQHIIGNLTFENISSIRLVSKDFNQACVYALNSEYIRVKREALKRHEYLQSQMSVIEEPLKHPLYNESKMIETVYMRLKVLNIKMGRYLERKELCFYGGKLLDEVNMILSGRKSKHPNPTEDMLNLCTMVDQHFIGQIRPLLPVPHILERWDTSMCMLLTDAKQYDSCSVTKEDILNDELLLIQSYTFKKPDEIFTQII